MQSKRNMPAVDVDEVLDAASTYVPDSEGIPPAEESDTTGALLRRIADHSSRSEPNLAYPDLGDDDYVDAEALHRIVEELQFGHDLQL